MKPYLPILLAAFVGAAVLGAVAAWLYPHRPGNHLGTGTGTPASQVLAAPAAPTPATPPK
ncbi:hypothetical protein [Lichenicola sp.]|uniref:hypothetical protein n=1 Tax=Lichenicola sp. TaxID=2804529 RepID=UPI003B00D75C